MKIIHTLEAPFKVLYAGADITLTEQGATSQSGSFDSTTTTANAALVSGVTLPELWAGGAYSYVGGVFEVINQDLIDKMYGTLASRQAVVWEAIKAHRERLSDLGGYAVTVGGVTKWFHSDLKSKMQQIALFVSGAAVPVVPWKTMDGSFVTMSQAWAVEIFSAGAVQEAAIFAAAETHRAAMLAAEVPEAYDFSGGWPAVYTPA